MEHDRKEQERIIFECVNAIVEKVFDPQRLLEYVVNTQHPAWARLAEQMEARYGHGNEEDTAVPAAVDTWFFVGLEVGKRLGRLP